MNKLVLFLLLPALTIAAPVIHWDKSSNNATAGGSYTSTKITASELLGQHLNSKNLANHKDGALSLVLLINRNSDGSERLSELTSTNQLPLVAERKHEATIHSQVRGVSSANGIQSMIHQLSSSTIHCFKSTSLQTLDEKLSTTTTTSTTSKKELKRRALLEKANTLVLEIPNSVEASEIDAFVSKTLELKTIDQVFLMSQYSAKEQHVEHNLMLTKAHTKNKLNNRRRLEQERNNEDNNNNQNDNQYASDNIYYVNMTPNILSGLLFTFFFLGVSYVGIDCMGMIQGQDVYVSKMPSVGREA